MTIIELARKLRPLIEKAAQSLSDDDAIEAVQLFPEWEPDGHYEAGERYRFNGTLYNALITHDAQNDPTRRPDIAVSLFSVVLPGQDGQIGPWQQPDSTNLYQPPQRVRHNGHIWECIAPNNSWEPGVYGWEQVE